MIEHYKLYLPKSKREIKIDVSRPKVMTGLTFDTFYFLDGQNAFKDSTAAFGRSIRAAKTLGRFAKEFNERILGIAIYNSGTDKGRIDEYSPFEIKNALYDSWLGNNVKVCKNLADDIVHTIIPFIDKKYPTKKTKESRMIYGSSLSAIMALYLGFNYNVFSTVASFSTASFLFEDELKKFILKKKKDAPKVFLYVGKQEISDSMKTPGLYYDCTMKLYNLFRDNNINTKLIVSISGTHNEACWEKPISNFLVYAYFKPDMDFIA